MSITTLILTAHDPLIARDGRPFGVGQGNRMRSLPWPMPSVVAGSFRTALVKGRAELDFTGTIPQELLRIAVAGVFPVHDSTLYLPAPSDAVAEPQDQGRGVKRVHRAVPQPLNTDGCDLPMDGLNPVMLALSRPGTDFKPAEAPAWWPVTRYAEWILGNDGLRFDSSFLCGPIQERRDHVCLDPERGAAAEGQIFTTAGLNVAHMPRFTAAGGDEESSAQGFKDRHAEVALSARITMPAPESESRLRLDERFQLWHPLGGERRLVHWQVCGADSVAGWTCPPTVRSALAATTKVRMVLATPAIFRDGWKPGWLTNGLEGAFSGVGLKLVGVSNGRWKAVSGWSLAPPRGPKPIRRMAPAGSVYFFEVARSGDAAPLADLWLQPVSDDHQEQRDGFGLAVWGTW